MAKQLRSCFHCKHGMKHSLFVLLIFFASLSTHLDFKRNQ